MAKFRQQRKGFVQTVSSLVIRIKGDRSLQKGILCSPLFEERKEDRPGGLPYLPVSCPLFSFPSKGADHNKIYSVTVWLHYLA